MKRFILLTSIAFIVIGFAVARAGDALSTVTESGMVQESILMPIGAILFILGFLALGVTVIWYFVSFIRGRLTQEKA